MPDHDSDSDPDSIPPAISLVLPAWNEEKYITPTLECVARAAERFANETGKMVEVIVVDNDSTDRTPEIAKKFGCTVVSYTTRHQMASVRNAGAKVAGGEFIAFVDADKSLFPDNIFIEIYNNLNDEGIIGGGCEPAADMDTLEVRLGLWAWRGFSWLTGIGAILFYLRREDFFALGGFNEEYYAAEDVEFAFRLKRLGKTRQQRIKNLAGPLTICCRKFGMVSRLKAAQRILALCVGRGRLKDPDAWNHFYYDVDKLR